MSDIHTSAIFCATRTLRTYVVDILPDLKDGYHGDIV